MERFQGHRPPKYQLAFDFDAQPLVPPQADGLRFTYAVKEEVKVRTPADAGHYLLTRVFTPFAAFEQEEVWVLLLNNQNIITHQSLIYRGTFNTVQLRIGEVFKPAIRYNAAGIVVSHLHPSGHPEPSPVIWRKSQTLTTRSVSE